MAVEKEKRRFDESRGNKKQKRWSPPAQDKKKGRFKGEKNSDLLLASAQIERMSPEELASHNAKIEAEIIRAIAEIKTYADKADFGL